ncbi:MAG TPA: pyridoxal-phosphate dependent enzyme, partial [Telluria sp.]|nr:pyridoxal-phosphate dependent enzyme [Telluria sp.]
TSLGARQVAQSAFDWSGEHPVRSVVVSDSDAVRACTRFMDEQRVVVEPACGAALAAVYANAPQLDGLRQVLVIVCGGVTATVAQLQDWERGFATARK